jgi:GNAT superfamily N-acetyltransferase
MVGTVRRLASTEWRTLREVRLRALRDAPYAFGSTYDAEIARDDKWWRVSAQALFWLVATNDRGEIVGLAAGRAVPDLRYARQVISMWVAPEARGSGIAGQLVTALIDWARGDGASALVLDVAEGNHRARRFYERQGFAPTGSQEPLKSNPGVSTLQMRLVLVPSPTLPR